jgi:hypothetical protein
MPTCVFYDQFNTILLSSPQCSFSPHILLSYVFLCHRHHSVIKMCAHRGLHCEIKWSTVNIAHCRHGDTFLNFLWWKVPIWRWTKFWGTPYTGVIQQKLLYSALTAVLHKLTVAQLVNSAVRTTWKIHCPVHNSPQWALCCVKITHSTSSRSFPRRYSL